jgi:hypothetical protein
VPCEERDRPTKVDLEAVAKMLLLAVPPAAVKMQPETGVREPDGIDDPWSRKITFPVKK